MTTPKSEWEWFGHALHFICAHQCQFRMATKIGMYAISTVGEMERPDSKRGKFEEIGCGRLYETMVFMFDGLHPCGCPDIVPSELDCEGYNDATAAQEGHMKMCHKYAEKAEGSKP